MFFSGGKEFTGRILKRAAAAGRRKSGQNAPPCRQQRQIERLPVTVKIDHIAYAAAAHTAERIHAVGEHQALDFRTVEPL